MFCKNCGKQLSDDERYCPGCGTKRPEDDAGDGIVRISADRPPAVPTEPTGFVNPLKDSGKTVFSDNNAAPAADGTPRDQAAPQARNGTTGTGQVNLSSQDAAAPTADPAAPSEGRGGFVNPLPKTGETIRWGSDGDRNTANAGDPTQISNYLGQSIAITVLALLNCGGCINLIIGIIAIVYASRVDKSLLAGDYDQAKKDSDTAKLLCWIAVILIIVQLVCSVIVFALMVIIPLVGSHP